MSTTSCMFQGQMLKEMVLALWRLALRAAKQQEPRCNATTTTSAFHETVTGAVVCIPSHHTCLQGEL